MEVLCMLVLLWFSLGSPPERHLRNLCSRWVGRVGAVEVGWLLWRLSSSTLPPRAESVRWVGCEYLQAWRLFNVSGQPFLLFNHLPCRNSTLRQLSVSQPVPVAFCPFSRHHWKTPAPSALLPQKVIYLEGHIPLVFFPISYSPLPPVGHVRSCRGWSCPFLADPSSA